MFRNENKFMMVFFLAFIITGVISCDIAFVVVGVLGFLYQMSK